MTSHKRWSRLLMVLGGIAMLLGTPDPLEGSVLIVPGSGLVALGVYLSQPARATRLYWLWSFISIALGVAAMFVLSAFGGIGGKSGQSMWWGLLLVPYPVGWFMALAGAIIGLMRLCKRGRQPAQA